MKFSKLPPHQVSFESTGMKIKVNKSAMPLIYPLAPFTNVSKIRIKGTLNGQLNLAQPELQGQKCCDDHVLKIGLVVKGSKRLNWLQKQIAPSWVKKLYSLAPKNGGIEHIYFLSAVKDKELLGRTRNHPLNEELLKEKVAWQISEPGKFDLEYTLDQPIETLALWLSVDGDDTMSTFELQLSSIELQ
ncbi:MAG: hypothetical protein R2827_07050 [Bdellovibrionales bacterium]